MSGLATAVTYALLAAAGAVTGVVVAEVASVSRRSLGIALHGATGVVLAIVALELIPSALAEGSPALVYGAFVAGAFAFIGFDALTGRVGTLLGGEDGKQGHWVLAVGIGMDLFTDGIMIAVGYAVDPALGLVLAVGTFLVEILEGFASAAVLKRRGVRRPVRLATMATLVLTIPLGAWVGWTVAARAVTLRVAVLAFTAGFLATLLVEEMVPQSHTGRLGRLATVAFILGFAGFAFVSGFIA